MCVRLDVTLVVTVNVCVLLSLRLRLSVIDTVSMSSGETSISAVRYNSALHHHHRRRHNHHRLFVHIKTIS